MRPFALLIHPVVLLILQQAVSIWFLVDFFLARDSSTAHNLRAEFGIQKGNLTGFQEVQESANNLQKKLCPGYAVIEPTFDKIILIVIDALGSEFIPTIKNHARPASEQATYSMPFIEQSLQQNKALGYQAKAASPTVTMPRIKALVSGTVPSFADILHNLARDVSDFHDDNILKTAKAHGKKLVFYGDDTWLSLFNRDMFLRVKETFSFFASDYTTVDTNVTERALPEVERDNIDWDYLILHYLGLDHIGHVYGTDEGPLIKEKLIEMDDVIKSIHDKMQAKKDHKTLMVICGDHGMSKEGNHGGDSGPEVNTAMVFLPINRDLRNSQHVDYDDMLQIDLAATLSLLTAMPIPKSSRGVASKGLLENLWFDDKQKVACSLLMNVLQLAKLSDEQSDSTHSTEAVVYMMQKHLTRSKESRQVSDTQEYYQLAREIQSGMMKTMASKSNLVMVMVAVFIVSLLSLANMRKASIRLLMPLMSSGERIVCILSLLVPILIQNSTDLIENEHIFWPLYSIAIFVLLSLAAIQRRVQRVGEISSFRLATFVITFVITATWNNLNLSKADMGWALPVVSLLILSNFSKETSKMRSKGPVFYITGVVTMLLKLEMEVHSNQNGDVTLLAWMQTIVLFWIILLAMINISLSFKAGDTEPTSIIQKMATHWMWFAVLLARPHNFVYLVSNIVMEASVNSIANSLGLSPLTRAIIYLQFASNAFYGQGNSNLFTSIDVRPAFYGQTEYSLMLAVPLVACATFSSQIYWYIKLFQRVQGEIEQDKMSTGFSSNVKIIPETTKHEVKNIIDMRNFLSLSYFMFVCVVLKNHLFIWSVISPKLVYHYTSNTILQLVTIVISNVPQLTREFLMKLMSKLLRDDVLHVID